MRRIWVGFVLVCLAGCTEPTSTTSTASQEIAESEGDWAVARTVNHPDLDWVFAGVGDDGGGATVSYAAPYTDWRLFDVSCQSSDSVSLILYGAEFEPHSRYELRARAGEHEVSTEVQSSERWEFEDLVLIETGALRDPDFIGSFIDGGSMTVIYRSMDGDGEYSGQTYSGDRDALTMFAAACEALP